MMINIDTDNGDDVNRDNEDVRHLEVEIQVQVNLGTKIYLSVLTTSFGDG